MMIYLIDQKFGDVNVKNLNVKRIIVNVLLEIRNAHQIVDVKIVKIRNDFHKNKKRNKKDD